MDKYENVETVGQGSYGIVMKCRHKESGQLVAIKKFLEGDDDLTVKKIALREIRMLKKLRHENLVNLIEVFRRRRRLYLVFEFVDHTILDELEHHTEGLDEEKVRQHTWQVLRALDFCHSHNIVHRDIKPENVLVSRLGVVKLCDFGFARLVNNPDESFTDYVATRWYRAPELLVGDTKYGKEVDVWAIGCLMAEMLTGDPLFPGESDIDQIFYITSYLGPLTNKHQQMLSNNPMFIGMKFTMDREITAVQKLSSASTLATELIKLCLQLDPSNRPSCTQLLNHKYFTWDRFSEKFIFELKQKIQKEFRNKPSLRKLFKPNNQQQRRTPGVQGDVGWKNGHNKGPVKDQKTSVESPPDESRVRFKMSTMDDMDGLMSKSSALSAEKTRLTPPKLMPVKIAPLNRRKSRSPPVDTYSSTTGPIPPINQFADDSRTSNTVHNTSSGIRTSNTSSPEGFKQFSLEKSSRKVIPLFQKKSIFHAPPSTSYASSISPGATNPGSILLDNLIQGERSQLHDKVSRSRRKSKMDGRTVNDDFSLPDVPGATGLVQRRTLSHRRPFLAPVMPSLLANSEQNYFHPQDEPLSPQHTYDSSFPLV